MLTILQYIWLTDRLTVLRLLALRFLEERFVESIIGEPLPKVDDDLDFRSFDSHERLMRHSAYKRGHGGALRQVRWG